MKTKLVTLKETSNMIDNFISDQKDRIENVYPQIIEKLNNLIMHCASYGQTEVELQSKNWQSSLNCEDLVKSHDSYIIFDKLLEDIQTNFKVNKISNGAYIIHIYQI